MCFTNPCQNNGTCLYVNGTNSYNCVCQDSFSGVNCTLVYKKEDGLAPGFIVLIVLVMLAFVGVVLGYLYWKRKMNQYESVQDYEESFATLEDFFVKVTTRFTCFFYFVDNRVLEISILTR